MISIKEMLLISKLIGDKMKWVDTLTRKKVDRVDSVMNLVASLE